MTSITHAGSHASIFDGYHNGQMQVPSSKGKIESLVYGGREDIWSF